MLEVIAQLYGDAGVNALIGNVTGTRHLFNDPKLKGGFYILQSFNEIAPQHQGYERACEEKNNTILDDGASEKGQKSS